MLHDISEHNIIFSKFVVVDIFELENITNVPQEVEVLLHYLNINEAF